MLLDDDSLPGTHLISHCKLPREMHMTEAGDTAFCMSDQQYARPTGALA